ncbi:MAG: hypothetical protein ACMG55_19870, partial [Microcoleus sp.]
MRADLTQIRIQALAPGVENKKVEIDVRVLSSICCEVNSKISNRRAIAIWLSYVKILSVWVTSSCNAALTPTSVALGNFDGLHLGHRQVVQPILNRS